MLSELSKTQKDRYCMAPLIQVSNNVRLMKQKFKLCSPEDIERERWVLCVRSHGIVNIYNTIIHNLNHLNFDLKLCRK